MRGNSAVLASAVAALVTIPNSVLAEKVNTISAIEFIQQGAQRSIRISGTTKPTFQRFTLAEPFRLVLDFVESQTNGVQPYSSIGDALVESIGVEQQGVGGTSLSRVMITFKEEVDYRISTDGPDVVISIEGDGAAGDVAEELLDEPIEDVVEAEPAYREPEPQPREIRVAQADTEDYEESGDIEVDGTPRAMTLCGFRFMNDKSRVFIRTNDKVQFAVRKRGDKTVVVELENTRIPIYNNQRFLDTQYFGSRVKLITPEAMEGGTPTVRVEIELRENVPYQTKQVDNEVWIDFPNR